MPWLCSVGATTIGDGEFGEVEVVAAGLAALLTPGCAAGWEVSAAAGVEFSAAASTPGAVLLTSVGSAVAAALSAGGFGSSLHEKSSEQQVRKSTRFFM